MLASTRKLIDRTHYYKFNCKEDSRLFVVKIYKILGTEGEKETHVEKKGHCGNCPITTMCRKVFWGKKRA